MIRRLLFRFFDGRQYRRAGELRRVRRCRRINRRDDVSMPVRLGLGCIELHDLEHGSSSTVTEVASGSTTSLMVLGDGHDSVYAGEVSVKDILIYSRHLRAVTSRPCKVTHRTAAFNHRSITFWRSMATR